ncbi:ABC transporter permease [Candidatus Soleaferrea massiliensis]|uniref:ABC transporter permease n=1 Tax=Candidatus Soleaferrea massiliensis TaxID=1470354 RepID=UPI00058B8A55|nr:ABC transporter permease [Candidatus Soleaferrea massiliensis]
MFSHTYINRLKIMVRQKDTMFWSLLFPLLLATLFYFAFSNLTSAENFEIVPVAVVDDAAYREDALLTETVKAVSQESDDQLFTVTYTDEEEAAKLLDEGKVDGYIVMESGQPKLVVKQSGINQTIAKAFLDEYIKTGRSMETIAEQNPAAFAQGLLEKLSERNSYTKEVPLGKDDSDPTVNYFYTLLAMTCLYGGFLGLKCVTDTMPTQSPQAARLNVAPVHKAKAFTYGLLAALTINLVQTLLVLAYVTLVLGVSFGSQIGFVLLAILAGCVTGVSFGAFLGTVIPGKENLKVALLIALSLLFCFLAGMMFIDMKYIIATNLPLLSYLNPATLLTDAFYTLYAFDNHNRFFLNLMLLGGMSVIMCTASYFVMRRQKYASL